MDRAGDVAGVPGRPGPRVDQGQVVRPRGVDVGDVGLQVQPLGEEAGGLFRGDRHAVHARSSEPHPAVPVNGSLDCQPWISRYLGGMPADFTPDRTDWRLLTELQRDGRATYADLARAVAMSPSAVAERVRRLEEAGVVAGYRAAVDPERVGLTVLAFVRLRYPTGNYRPFHALLDSTPEIVEAHHVTGEDCFVLKVLARSMRHLEEVTGRIAGLGSVTTSVVYSSPLAGRAIAEPERQP